MSAQDQTRIIAWSLTASPPQARASNSSSTVWPANPPCHPASWRQGYRTGSRSFPMPLAAALPRGASPLSLSALPRLVPRLYGLGSVVTQLRALCDNRRSPASFIPLFPSGGASPSAVWAGSLPSLGGESGRIFWKQLSPPPSTQGPSPHFFLPWDSVVRCQP